MTELSDAFSNIAKTLKIEDTDRYLSSLFAPPPHRAALQSLYAFENELRSVPDRVTEPLLGEIRLQWWREAIEEIYEGKAPRAHEVVLVLAETIRHAKLPREPFDQMIDARAFDLYDEPMKDWDAFETYAEGTEVTGLTLAAKVLYAGGEPPMGVLQSCGQVSALLNGLRHKTFGFTHRQLPLPTGIEDEEILTRLKEGLRTARESMSDLPSEIFPAILHFCLVEEYVKRLKRFDEEPSKVSPTGLAKRLKLLKHSLLGKL